MMMYFDSVETEIIARAVERYKEDLYKLMTQLPVYAYDSVQENIALCDDILVKCGNADD